MDEKLKAAVVAAVNAYIDKEKETREVYFGQKLSAWKMGGRREIIQRGRLARRGNPSRVRLRRFSFL